MGSNNFSFGGMNNINTGFSMNTNNFSQFQQPDPFQSMSFESMNKNPQMNMNGNNAYMGTHQSSNSTNFGDFSFNTNTNNSQAGPKNSGSNSFDLIWYFYIVYR